MRSMGEGLALAILTFWRGDTLNAPLYRLRRSRCCSATPSALPYRGGITLISSPCRGGINTGGCPSQVYG
jgi:hypothetical protein